MSTALQHLKQDRELSSASTLSIPVETYMSLERLVQSLRLRILSDALTSPKMNNRDGIRLALAQFLENPPSDGLVPVPDPETETSVPTQDAFLFLERQLHNLRVLVVTMATEEARRTSNGIVLPAHIERIWKHIFQHQQLLRGALNANVSCRT